MDEVQKPNDFEFYTPSSEPFIFSMKKRLANTGKCVLVSKFNICVRQQPIRENHFYLKKNMTYGRNKLLFIIYPKYFRQQRANPLESLQLSRIASIYFLISEVVCH
jgi:hypothetical protein